MLGISQLKAQAERMLDRVRSGMRIHVSRPAFHLDELGQAIVLVIQGRHRGLEQQIVRLGLDEAERGRVWVFTGTGQDGLQELEVLPRGTVQTAAARIRLQVVNRFRLSDRFSWQRNERTASRPSPDLHQTLSNIVPRDKGRILQSQRFEHFLLEVVFQRESTDT